MPAPREELENVDDTNGTNSDYTGSDDESEEYEGE